ncbi:MAG: glycosyltransferase, partial [Phycisphaerae bacterium]
IDNASKDQTAALVEERCRAHGLPLRLLAEPTPGLAHARRCAALAAQSETLCFLDDDTVVEPDWCAECVRFMQEHPQAGIVGARVQPLLEDPARRPADFTERFAPILSVFDQGNKAHRLDMPLGPTPVGAGMVGQRSLYRLVFDELKSLNVGRQGESLAGGEDLEAVFIAHHLGLEIWYDPALRVQHFIPAARVTEQYRDRWIVDTARCHAWLLLLSTREPRQEAAWYAQRTRELERRARRYAFLAALPGGRWLHPKLARSAFWKRYYRSLAAGYRALGEQLDYVDHVFKVIARQRQAATQSAGSSTWKT